MEIEPFSFLSAHLLQHISQELVLQPGNALADLGCGRGGPGLWLARAADADLVGVDFSTAALLQARQRIRRFGLAGRARFVPGDIVATGLPTNSMDAAVSIDALQYAADRAKVSAEVHRILRPGARLVLTGWHPRTSGDPRLPSRHRHTDWGSVLEKTGFLDVRCVSRPEWTETYLHTYRVALQYGDPGEDTALAGLQEEARRRLGTAHLLRRVAVTATAAAA